MIKLPLTLIFINYLARPMQQLSSFFRRLQWKLTLAYTLSTIITVLILGGIGVAVLWYMNFGSNMLPNMIADALIKGVVPLRSYLEQNPPDQAGLRRWLAEVSRGNNLIIPIARENTQDENDTIPAQFGRIVLVAIVDQQGEVLAATPEQAALPGARLQAQLSPEATAKLQAALAGETEPAQLSMRDPAGHMVAAAPILDANEQALGAIFVTLTFPIEEGEFLQNVLRGAILPVAVAMLVAGLIAGVIFGFLIARGLTRRLGALDKAADAWSRGNFSVLAPDTSADELGQLARHFNQMALQLQNLFQTHQELATLEERNRLARDLHDSVKQQVFAVAMQVGAAHTLLPQNPAAAKAHLTEAKQLVQQMQQELTSLIRELRPAALEDKGLATALRDYVTDWSRHANIVAEVRVRGERSLSLPLEQALFRVAQEALANVTRHSQATTVEVDLAWQTDEIILTVADNGQGFNTATMNGTGVGLKSMRERIEALGGELRVESKPGAGTRVTARCRAMGH